jgi:hypothetical protein
LPAWEIYMEIKETIWYMDKLLPAITNAHIIKRCR